MGLGKEYLMRMKKVDLVDLVIKLTKIAEENKAMAKRAMAAAEGLSAITAEDILIHDELKSTQIH